MVEPIELAHAEELDAFVRRQPNCHFMQTSFWGRVKTDWAWRGLICRDSRGEICGTMALLEHRLRFCNASLLYAPRGPIFRDNAAFAELISAAKDYAAQRHAYVLRIDPAISENDVQFASMTHEFRRNTATDFSLFQPRMCYCLDLRGKTEDVLFAGYHATTRRNIRIALREGVTVRRGGIDDLPSFCKMMAQTAAKSGFLPRNAAYFRAFLTGMGENATLWLAEKDGIPLAASISVTYGCKSWFMYGCSDPNRLKEHPNELLQWTMQREALRGGCDWFDLRGVEGEPTPQNPKFGLHAYKQHFGAEFRAYIGQLDAVLRPNVDRALRLLGRL